LVNLLDFVTNELQAIKEGIKQAYEMLGFAIDTFSLPFATLVVAMSQHGIHIVPAKAGSENVQSGTCVDLALHGIAKLHIDEPAESRIFNMMPDFEQARVGGLLLNGPIHVNDGKFDFQLIPQK
jgi:hypothetical protein